MWRNLRISPKSFSTSGNPPHHRSCYLDDARQEAAIGLIRSNGKCKNYAFTAATRQAMQWMFTFLWEDKSHRVGKYALPQICGLSEDLARFHRLASESAEDVVIEKEESASYFKLIDEAADIILEIMKASRKQKVGRAVTAAVRDTNSILLSLQGYSSEGIAFELGMSKRDVSSYISQARKRIEKYLLSVNETQNG